MRRVRIHKGSLKALSSLRHRPTRDWEDIVRSVAPMEVRVRVACIVWWDFLSTRRAENTYIDYLKDRYRATDAADVPSDPIIAGLIAVGYPESVAKNRVIVTLRDRVRPKKLKGSPGADPGANLFRADTFELEDD